MYYIEESDKPNKILKILKLIKTVDNKIILPVNGEELNEKYQYKMAKKTYKILEKTNSNKVVISKKINNYIHFKNYLYSLNIDIVDGKWLFRVMIPDILNYVIEKYELRKQQIELSVLINDASDIEIQQIKEFANEYKRLNVVTNHINKFKNLEDKIYEETGNLITINNNKKKSLSKSKIIINYDFPNELINKYNIYDEAIIVSNLDKIKIDKKRFNGINIKDFEINKNEDLKYDSKQLYEAKFFKKQTFEYIKNKLKEDNVKIVNIKGNSGSIL